MSGLAMVKWRTVLRNAVWHFTKEKGYPPVKPGDFFFLLFQIYIINMNKIIISSFRIRFSLYGNYKI
jgi:hypothetical protein